MALDDYMESEVALAVAATAAILSPGARRVVRRGLVLGVAGAMKAADAVTSTARGVAQQAPGMGSSDGAGQQPQATPAGTTS